VVENGQTVVLGGLMKDSTSDTLTKIPVLGDLPFVGALFRQKSETSSRKNLLIFITAHILTDDKARALTQVAVQQSGRPAAFPEAVLPQRQKRLKLQPRGKQAL